MTFGFRESLGDAISNTELTSDEFAALGEGSLWPRFLLFPTVAVLGEVCFMYGWAGENLFIKLIWSIAIGYCWFCVAGSFHEAVHQTMGRWPIANIWFGRIVGTMLGIPYTAYRETHIRHHAYLSTEEDFELWPYSHPNASLAFRRAFVLFDILAAVIAAPVVYGRIYFVRKSPLSAKARATITREYLSMFAFWIVILFTTATLSLSGTIDLNQFDPFWLLPIAIAATLNTFRKFTEHLGIASTDPILGTRTVIGNNGITRLCSYFNFELFVHGPHHRFPRASHFELESKLAEYQLKHPEIVIPIFSSYLAAVQDMLPCLWHNPAVGTNAGSQDTDHLPFGVEDFPNETEVSFDDSNVRRAA